MHMYVRPHTLSLPHPRPPRLVSDMRVRTHTLTATFPSAPPTVPPTASPTLPSSYPCSHALPHIRAHLCGPAHSLTPSPYPRYARPPRPAQTCSHPRHALSLDKYVQTYVHSPSFARPPSLL